MKKKREIIFNPELSNKTIAAEYITIVATGLLQFGWWIVLTTNLLMHPS